MTFAKHCSSLVWVSTFRFSNRRQHQLLIDFFIKEWTLLTFILNKSLCVFRWRHALSCSLHQQINFFQQPFVYQIEVVNWHRTFALGTTAIVLVWIHVTEQIDLKDRTSSKNCPYLFLDVCCQCWDVVRPRLWNNFDIGDPSASFRCCLSSSTILTYLLQSGHKVSPIITYPLRSLSISFRIFFVFCITFFSICDYFFQLNSK